MFKKKIPTTKKLMFFLFVNCTLIELFTGWVTIQNIALAREIGMSLDFTPLVTLIGTVVGEVLSFAVYAAKSAKENTQGGIVYETTINNSNNAVG